MATKTYELHLPYYKQGDDLQFALERTGNDSKKALELHAEMLEVTATMLREVSEVEGIKVEVADCHFIEVSCDEINAAKLVADEILTEPEFDDEDECDCEDEDCVN
jgi:hypothetical protein